MTRLTVLFARRAARIWTTPPLALADKVTLLRRGDWELAVIRHRTTRRPTR